MRVRPPLRWSAPLLIGSGHVLVEPLEHGRRTTLELHVAIPAGGRALDPVELLVRHWNVVVHRLNVARVSDAVAANLVEERRHTDVFGPLLRDSAVKPDAGVQADQGVEVVEAVAEAKEGQPALDYVPRGDWLRRQASLRRTWRLRPCTG